ncbi:unnamed protein product [Acanthosepion pharaonis]|uniref:Uncharacterized protein n=1 Tax=Acanthosepion pharaonis TaxID=158019 RepID=A0A812C6I2_ACAPH|nr:unnamed protein product [Sepia pharaonis]
MHNSDGDEVCKIRLRTEVQEDRLDASSLLRVRSSSPSKHSLTYSSPHTYLSPLSSIWVDQPSESSSRHLPVGPQIPSTFSAHTGLNTAGAGSQQTEKNQGLPIILSFFSFLFHNPPLCHICLKVPVHSSLFYFPSFSDIFSLPFPSHWQRILFLSLLLLLLSLFLSLSFSPPSSSVSLFLLSLSHSLPLS